MNFSDINDSSLMIALIIMTIVIIQCKIKLPMGTCGKKSEGLRWYEMKRPGDGKVTIS